MLNFTEFGLQYQYTGRETLYTFCKTLDSGKEEINMRKIKPKADMSAENENTCALCGKDAEVPFRKLMVCEECLRYVKSNL